MNQTIQIFASDHRKNVEWNLPFIRVLDSNDAAINFANDSFLYENRDVLSEASRMIYIYEHLSEFGNPDYVGFCHYRRFFADVKVDAPWLETSDHSFEKMILNPSDQLRMIQASNVNGIIEHHFLEVQFNGVQDINTWFKALNQFLERLRIPEELIDFSIDQFYQNVEDWLKPFFVQAYSIMPIYHQNIFTVDRTTLDLVMKPLCKSVREILKFEADGSFQKKKYSGRWLAYIIEYLFTNVMFHALELTGKFKFQKCKFLVLK